MALPKFKKGYRFLYTQKMDDEKVGKKYSDSSYKSCKKFVGRWLTIQSVEYSYYRMEEDHFFSFPFGVVDNNVERHPRFTLLRQHNEQANA